MPVYRDQLWAQRSETRVWEYFIFTIYQHAGGRRCVGMVINVVCDFLLCVSVRSLKGKRLELSTPNLVCKAGPCHALTMTHTQSQTLLITLYPLISYTAGVITSSEHRELYYIIIIFIHHDTW